MAKGILDKQDLDPRTSQLINEVALCETFGWRPKDLLEMDLFYIDSFSAILVGRQEGQKAKK